MDTERRSRDRVPELDLLRFVAAASVVLFHLMREGVGAVTARYGFMGVELFFIISGFVILWTASEKSGPQFVATRLARLYPSFWLCVVITTGALIWADRAPTPATFLANLTMVPKWLGYPPVDAVYWTLVVEIYFYAIIFVLQVTRQLQRLEWFLLAWLILCTLQWPDVMQLRGNAPLFISGCVLFLMRSRGPSVRRSIILGWSAGLAINQVAHHHVDFTHFAGTQPVVIVCAVMLVIYAAMTAIAMRWVRLPSHPAWYILGSMTYPLYLLHNVPGLILLKYLPDWVPGKLAVTLVIVVTAAAAVAWLTERRVCPWVQKRLLALLERVSDRSTGTAPLRCAGMKQQNAEEH